MSKFFDDTMQGLLEAVAIKNNNSMTYKQTKEQFLLAWNSNAYLNMCTSDDMKNVISAIDKQIPNKPIGEFDSVPHYRCPNCHGAVVMYCDDHQYPCCQWCGQALDWS